MSEVAAAAPSAPAAAPSSGGGASSSAPANAPSNGHPSVSSRPQPTPATKEAAPAEKPAPRKLAEPIRLKVKGREEVIDDVDRLTHLASKGYGSDETFAEAKKLREEAAADKKLTEALRSKDPKAIRRALRENFGVEPDVLRAMSEDELYEAIQAEQMTPEQRELAELKAWKAKQEEAQKSEAQKKEEAAQQEADDREYSRLETLFAGALQKTGAPSNAYPWLMQRMAKLEERNASLRIDSTPDELAAEALDGVRAEQTTITKDMSGDDLIGWIGEEAIKKIRTADLARLRAQMQQRPPPTPKPQQNNNQPQEKPRRFDWRTNRFVEG